MTQSNTRNRKFVLAERPEGEPDDNTLRLEIEDPPIPAKARCCCATNTFRWTPTCGAG